jgi:hypothetical protein
MQNYKKTFAQITKNSFLYFVNKQNMCIFAVQKTRNKE